MANKLKKVGRKKDYEIIAQNEVMEIIGQAKNETFTSHRRGHRSGTISYSTLMGIY
jgi:hypothetical protein